jgi:hypothetical protein
MRAKQANGFGHGSPQEKRLRAALGYEGFALIAAAIAISHRYEIRAMACSPSETVCSRSWRVDQ